MPAADAAAVSPPGQVIPAPALGRRGPAPAIVGALVEPIYRRIIAHRNRRFDTGRGVARLPIPVISVGNLSVGGTGKTPMVAYLLRLLQRTGIRPCVAMRGYMRSFHPAPSAPGGTVRSDEARMYLEMFPGVPVVAQPDRAEGVRALLAQNVPIDCVVLDDGFQHRRLARDLDIVLVDASRSPFDDALLPAGWLREPVESLRRAGVAVVTHAEMVKEAHTSELVRRIVALNQHAVVAIARHDWTGLRIHRGRPEIALADQPPESGDYDEPVGWLAGRRVLGVCAIGNPAAFLHAVRRAGATISDEVVLPDHDPYRPRTRTRIIDRATACSAEAIVTTEKDWAKLCHAGGRAATALSWPCPVVRPRLAMRFIGGEEEVARCVLDAARGSAKALTAN